jgi:hypothetical protein
MNRNGFVTVFLSTLILPCILLVTVLIEVSSYYEHKAYIAGLSDLTANTAMSFYERYLFNNYGLLCFDSMSVNDEVNKTIESNLFKDKIQIEQIKTNVPSDLEIRNLDLIKEQIISYQIPRTIYSAIEEIVPFVKSFTDEDSSIEQKLVEISQIYEEVLSDYILLDEKVKELSEMDKAFFNDYSLIRDERETAIFNMMLYLQQREYIEIQDEVEGLLDKIRTESIRLIYEKDKAYQNAISIYDTYNQVDDILIRLSLSKDRIDEHSNELYNNELKHEYNYDEANKIFSLLDLERLKDKTYKNIIIAKEMMEEINKHSFKLINNSKVITFRYQDLSNITYEEVAKNIEKGTKLHHSDSKDIKLIDLGLHIEELTQVREEIDIINDITTIKESFSSEVDMVEVSIKGLNDSLVSNRSVYSKNNDLKNLLTKFIFIDYLSDRCTHYLSNDNKVFFEKSELEYLLVGQEANVKNIEGAKNRILALRTVLNLSYIITNDTLRETISTLTDSLGIINPILKPIATIAISTTIAFVESFLDYKELIESKRVPIFKDSSSWKLSKENIVSLITEGVLGVKNQSDEGLLYDQYIIGLMLIVNEEVLLKRLLDLIELNYNYNYQNTREITNLDTKFSKFSFGITVDIKAEYLFSKTNNLIKIPVNSTEIYEY